MFKFSCSKKVTVVASDAKLGRSLLGRDNVGYANVVLIVLSNTTSRLQMASPFMQYVSV
jgi:hypothetical protein